MRKCLLGLLLVVAAAWNWEAFAGERRMALVIGNGAYTGAGRLANTTNDATAIAGVLDELGFEVTLVLDVDRRAAISAMVMRPPPGVSPSASATTFGGTCQECAT